MKKREGVMRTRTRLFRCVLLVMGLLVFDGLVPVTEQERVAAQSSSPTLRTSGRRLLDTCGNAVVIRGVEQILGEQLPPGNNWLGLIDQIAATGANAVRILPSTTTIGLSTIDAALTRVGSYNMIVYLTPMGGGRSWLG